MRRGPARNAVPGRLLARPLHRHGFPAGINGVGCIATMRGQRSRCRAAEFFLRAWSGVSRNWWTKEDRDHFEERTHSLVAQYDAFFPLAGYYVIGVLTLGENVADNARLAVAMRAYRMARQGCPAAVIDGFSGEQRLFISLAQIWHDKVRETARIEPLKVDSHSPGQFRANGSLRNQTAFVQPFDLKPTDAMYLPRGQRI
jgi:putative endopeptidase